MDLDIEKLIKTATENLNLKDFKGDVVAFKYVENEIGNVEEGGIGVQKIDHVDKVYPSNPELLMQSASKNSMQNGMLDDDALRDCINLVMHRVTKNRSWFPIVKVLMLRGQVRPNDFAGAAARINKLYPAGLPCDIDVSDLQAMHIGSFVGPMETWSIADGPFKREAEFKTCHKLACDFEKIVKDRLLF